MIPSADSVVNIWLNPLLGVDVEDLDLIELHEGVPSSINVDLVVISED